MRRILISIAFAAVAVCGLGKAQAMVPDLLPIQGVLTDQFGDTITGSVNVQFAIYDAETAGTLLWSELHNGSNQVVVDDGFFTVYLGNLTTIDFELLLPYEELWLGITVGLDDEMARIRLATVPFAEEANYCRQIGDMEAEDIQPVLDFTCGGDQFLRGWDPDGGAICDVDITSTGMDGGTITDVYAGAGLDKQWVSGNPELSVVFGTTAGTVAEGDHNHDANYSPIISGGPCGAGSFVSNVSAAGVITCTAEDTGEVYTNGFGLNLATNEFSVDSNVIQVILNGSCAAGEFVDTINPTTGAFTCATPPGTTYTEGEGIDIVSDAISVDFAVAQRIVNSTTTVDGMCEDGDLIKGIDPATGLITCVLDQTVTGDPGDGILSVAVQSPPLTGGGNEANEFIGIDMGPGAGQAAWGDHNHDTVYPAIADTLAGITCGIDQVVKWDGSGWICGADDDTDTTAADVCTGANVYLDGNGSCNTIDLSLYQDDIDPTSCQYGIASIANNGTVTCSADNDSNAETLCNAGEYLSGSGSCDSLLAGCSACDADFVNTGEASSVTSTMITDGTIVAADIGAIGNCSTICTDANTNAETVCVGSTYLSGTGSCDPMPTLADTNAATECTGLTYLSGNNTCDSLLSACSACNADFVNEGQADSITSGMIVNSTITGADIAANTITAADIATGAVASSEILDNSITAADIAASAVGSSEIADGSITAADMGAIGACDNICTDANTNAQTICGAGLYLSGSGSCDSMPAPVTDTNAETICPSGTYLNGDGGCDPMTVDTNAGTICGVGEVLLGDGSCTNLPNDTNAQTICAAGFYLSGSGSCDPMTVDTNAQTICGTGTYLNGDGGCDPMPSFTDTNAETLCGDGTYLNGDGVCYSVIETCPTCDAHNDGRYLLRTGDTTTHANPYNLTYTGGGNYGWEFHHDGTSNWRYGMMAETDGADTAVSVYGGRFRAINTTSYAYGVTGYGEVRSSGAGVYGYADDYGTTATSASYAGVRGSVEHFNTNRTGPAIGVDGDTYTEGSANVMIGVRGQGTEGDWSLSGTEFYGGWFRSDSYGEGNSYGVYVMAEQTGASGAGDVYGVYVDTNNTGGGVTWAGWFNGDVAAQAYHFINTQTGYWTVHGTALQPYNHTEDYSMSYIAGYTKTVGSGAAYAPVNLPNGVTVTSVTLNAYDNAGANPYCYLMRSWPETVGKGNNWGIMATAQTTGLSNNNQIRVDNTIVDAVVNNVSYNYLLYCMGYYNATDNYAINEIQIEYDYTIMNH
jgi:hypothetical protein